MDLLNQSLNVLSGRIGSADIIEKLQNAGMENPDVAEKIIDVASFVYVYNKVNWNKLKDTQYSGFESKMDPVVSAMVEHLKTDLHETGGVAVNYAYDELDNFLKDVDRNMLADLISFHGGIVVREGEEGLYSNFINKSLSFPSSDGKNAPLSGQSPLFPSTEVMAGAIKDLLDENENSVDINEKLEELPELQEVKDDTQPSDIQPADVSDAVQTPVVPDAPSYDGFEANVDEKFSKQYQHTISYVLDALNTNSSKDEDWGVDIMAPAAKGKGDKFAFRGVEYYLDDNSQIINKGTDVIAANGNSLSIQHSKITDVEYSSVLSGIWGMRDMMMDNEKVPFVFNFNAKTPKFVKLIGLSMFQYLGQISENDVNVAGVRVNGVYMSIDDLREKVQATFEQKYAGKVLDDDKNTVAHGAVFADVFEDLFAQSQQNQSANNSKKSKAFDEATEKLNDIVDREQQGEPQERPEEVPVNPFDFVDNGASR